MIKAIEKKCSQRVGAVSKRPESARPHLCEFCTMQHIELPEKAPLFGGLWESAVKSMKYQCETHV